MVVLNLLNLLKLCLMFNCVISILLQGDQGPQGSPGPFEYVEPNPEDYVKGDKVNPPRVKLVFSC